MKRLTGLLVGISMLGLLLACGPAPLPTGTPGGGGSATLEDVCRNPLGYLGQEVTVEGVVESEGQGLDVRFFLRASEGARLQVTPWAPLEVMHPPTGEGPVPHTMLDYIGKHLRLTGVIARVGEEGYILNVEKTEEVP